MHKFTMHDLPSEKNGYREKATDIEIQQSHSYEIKEQGNYQPTASQSYQQEQVYEDPVPVIVLRIPGPQKYALHLQALLQQYLEIRASQYIKALEDQERRGHLHHPQHYVAQQQQHMQHQQMQYMSMPVYQHQQSAYYQQHHQQPPHGYQQYFQVNHGNHYPMPTAGEQSYYTQATQQEYHHPSTQMQQEYPSSYINFVTPTYDHEDLQPQVQVNHDIQPQVHHQHQVHHQQHDVPQDHSLETSENFPSDKHTRVIFKKKKNRVHRPSITYHQSAPIVVPDQPQHHQHQEEEVYQIKPANTHQSAHQLYAYTNNFNDQEDSEVVTVTQRTQSQQAPVNYHVQSTLAPTHEELNERHHPKRMAPFSKEQFEKARRIMTKSKRNRGSLRQEKQGEKKVEAPKS
jgi:hypothetical protein